MALLLALLIKLGRYSNYGSCSGCGCCFNGKVAPLVGRVGCLLGDPVGDLVGNLVGEVVGDLVGDMVGSFNCAWLL
jgi:hypothetical protein